MTEHPHVPAAFINAIAEDGTKAEAVEWLQKLWNENCALRSQAESASNSDLTKLAAELHRSKWQFDLSMDYQPSKAAARGLITKAFDELHRIGDMAMTMRDQSKPLRSPPKSNKIELARNAFDRIKTATLNGTVCDDVAWIGPGETLHDYCDEMIALLSREEQV